MLSLRHSVDANNQTFKNLTQRFIKEKAKMNTINEASGALAAMNVKSNKDRRSNQERQKTSWDKQHFKKEVTCFYCQKRGHIAKECRKKKKDWNNYNSAEKDKKKDDTSESSAFVVETYTSLWALHLRTSGFLIVVLQSTWHFVMTGFLSYNLKRVSIFYLAMGHRVKWWAQYVLKDLSIENGLTQ